MQQERWIFPFELEEKIGDGGMGVVYRARYVKDDRRVAVKLLPADLTDQTILARFEREMEVMKTLKHPNVVRCFGGVCGDKKQRFYAMEFVEGGTLADILREKTRLPWQEAIEYALQMCRALAYAHSKGVVHRDVKPGNFLVTNTGKLKLSDFGLISIAAESRLTAAGKTMGTIPYMAPEQIRGTPPPSPRTDLYALGCVLFEMLVGHPPFKGNTPAETMHQHLHDTPPRISRYVRDCPRALENLVRKLLKKNPDERPPDAVSVARELEDIWQAAALGDETVAADALDESGETSVAAPRPAARAEKQGVPPLLFGLVMAVLASLLVWNLALLGRSRAPSRAEKRWFEALRSDEAAVRVEAAKVLAEIGPGRQEAAEALTRGLSDSSPEVRLAAAKSLAQLGAQARSASAALLRLQNTDENAQVREQAAATLAVISKSDEGGSWGVYTALLIVVGLAVAGVVVAVRYLR